ncbi:MAG: hypothetical protein PCFJNLEI_01984 [Verrucomicrobiae bacterium]|nr:hypothetical protein [Verrucomicrobiae bacterium]
MSCRSTKVSEAPQDLYAAARSGNLARVKELVEAGADVNARDQVGETPLHKTARWGQPEVAVYLLNHHADVNAKTTENGHTALHIAASAACSTNIANILLSRSDIDVKAVDFTGETASFQALKWHCDTVRKLIEAKEQAH